VVKLGPTWGFMINGDQSVIVNRGKLRAGPELALANFLWIRVKLALANFLAK